MREELFAGQYTRGRIRSKIVVLAYLPQAGVPRIGME
jgi:hypothetical protein